MNAIKGSGGEPAIQVNVRSGNFAAWAKLRYDDFVPAANHTAFQMTGAARLHGYSFDDFSVERIPEPSTGGLVGLGSVLLAVLTAGRHLTESGNF